MDRKRLCLLPVLLLMTSGCGEPSGGGLPTLVPSRIPAETSTDYALTFNGTGQYATTATAYFPVAKSEQSIVVWLKPSTEVADQAVFTLRRDVESGTQLGFSGGRVTVWNVWGMRVFVQGDEPLKPERWYHIAYVQAVVDADAEEYEQRLFVDGELIAEGTLPPQSRTPTSSWLGTFDGTTMHYAGSMDDLRLYARALSDSEVARAAAGGVLSDSDGLVAAWNFNEALGQAFAYDRSGRHNHATLGDGVASLMPERTVSDAVDR